METLWSFFTGRQPSQQIDAQQQNNNHNPNKRQKIDENNNGVKSLTTISACKFCDFINGELGVIGFSKLSIKNQRIVLRLMSLSSSRGLVRKLDFSRCSEHLTKEDSKLILNFDNIELLDLSGQEAVAISLLPQLNSKFPSLRVLRFLNCFFFFFAIVINFLISFSLI
jgi:hypothetical protein